MKVNIREVGRVWGGAALDGGRERKKGENRPRRRRKSLKYVSRGGEESRKDGDVEQGQHNKKKRSTVSARADGRVDGQIRNRQTDKDRQECW